MKYFYSKISLITLLVALPSVSFAASKVDAVQKFPSLNQKLCSIKYDNEVQAISKLIDKKKAKKKLEEMRTLRKEQEMTLRTTLRSLEEKAETEEEKLTVSERTENLMKAFADKNSKMYTLQSSTIISDREIDSIVASTILEEDATEVTCPITLTNTKQIRKTNTEKLKKLADDKKRDYLYQTKQIQSGFLETLGETLPEIDAIIQ